MSTQWWAGSTSQGNIAWVSPWDMVNLVMPVANPTPMMSYVVSHTSQPMNQVEVLGICGPLPPSSGLLVYAKHIV